ncbi:phosphonoacetaldehyde hydrolase [Domibacillus sp. DTU_2020_1001157_1_SI_ALB_TIR_016]|uniref:phosphonoacetaldehyde hydrolase n=1 Tax=Domibacillus sp. DTU_2020_1001157_1_SI_ALB_TIR_016 TaxID=3077789 RepID=UPI0028E38BA3|nr:phosphonoacetaldehyde hydrolase [Domibacillus sp. DTU_2020_1001157_1_SI_ALB_TIR_016]WNS78482.1 phosphonoacetaldehyde hydrolase [Domibacillus sp. DTU_2020_1001157_1_SI_ALB_TIR_016]
MKYLQGVLLDWAGTTVDYGCMAPVGSFIEMFKEKGITVTMEETRKPMGMAKIDHIRTMLEMPGIRAQLGNKAVTEKEVIGMNTRFEELLFKNLANYATPIPGAVDAINDIIKMQLKIGTTTGYTREMMDVVRAGAAQKGYAPDIVITADDVDAGRPFPWMAYIAAMKMGVYPMNRIVKVGDTVIDMEEGRNAGTWTVGLVYGSSEFGLTQEETNQLSNQERLHRAAAVRKRLLAAGAHYVLDTIEELPAYLQKLDQKLTKQEVLV